MSLQVVEWAAAWPMVLPYFDGSVPAGFPSPAEDYLETPLDLHDFLIENKAATFLLRVDGDSMRDADILDGDLLVVDRAVKPDNGCVVVGAVITQHLARYSFLRSSDSLCFAGQIPHAGRCSLQGGLLAEPNEHRHLFWQSQAFPRASTPLLLTIQEPTVTLPGQRHL